jgi:hypothetical protein
MYSHYYLQFFVQFYLIPFNRQKDKHSINKYRGVKHICRFGNSTVKLRQDTRITKGSLNYKINGTAVNKEYGTWIGISTTSFTTATKHHRKTQDNLTGI